MTLPVWQGLAAREENTDIVVLASPTVTVTNAATGGQPSLFSDRAGTNPLGNPFTANADGSIEFYVAPGRYKIEAAKGGSTVTWENQLIGTMHGIDSPADGEFAEYDAGNDRWAARQAGYVNPEHATDAGGSPADDFESATNTTPPAAGVKITRDFQSANTTTTPTLDTLTITTRDGSALWAGALSGVHDLQLNAGGTAWLVLDPNPVSANSANAGVQRDANGRAQFADPSAAQDAATKAYADAQDATFEQQRAQAWVNFNGTGTVSIRDHYNVSSITDNGTGDYTVNFTANLADTNYSIATLPVPNSGSTRSGTMVGPDNNTSAQGQLSTSSVRLLSWAGASDTTSGTASDIEIVSVQIFGGN